MGQASIFTTGLPGLPSASNMVFASGNIQLTAQEQFRDRLAYRDAVSAVMREKELDDTHDRAGMTLYTLKFDLSVLPGADNRWPGVATVSFSGPTDSEGITNFYKRWVESFRRTFDAEVMSAQRRYQEDNLSDDEKRKLVVTSWIQMDRLQEEIERSELL